MENRKIRELTVEVLFDFGGKILIDSVKAKQLKVNGQDLLEILMADAVYVFAMKELIYGKKEATNFQEKAIYDFVGKYASRVLIKMLRGQKPRYFDMAIDGLVGEAGSSIVEMIVAQSRMK